MARIKVKVDGVQYVEEIKPRTLLVEFLRDNLGKVGTVVGCDTAHCGSCTVLVSGGVGHDAPRAVKSCVVLAVQVNGGAVTTIEGLDAHGAINHGATNHVANTHDAAARAAPMHPLQRAFHEYHAVQCGFCTPGMILTALDLLSENPEPTEAEVRAGLSGNLCRCTGYQNIVRAVLAAAALLVEQRAELPDAALTRAEFVRTAEGLAVEAEGVAGTAEGLAGTAEGLAVDAEGVSPEVTA
jgi:carbon-monoxide dehydrogenase small subunit